MALDAQKPWPADKVERRPIDSLVNYARNSRVHTPKQIDQIAASIREWGWTIPVLVSEDSTIIAGHARVAAAKKLGITEVPVMVAERWSEAQKRAYVIADNKLTMNSSFDDEMLVMEISDIMSDGFDIKLTGFDMSEINFLVHGDDAPPEGGLSDNYSRDIESPVYQPRADKPPPAELYDDRKASELTSEIRAAKLPADIEQFLSLAAQRHTVFDFAKIADFYAHSGPDVQRLMEKSALVIIDFNKAIENGFVRLTKSLGELCEGASPGNA